MARPSTISADDVRGAASALLDERGVDAVTMRAVGERLGVSAMALYRHVGDRDSLLAAVVDRAFESLGARFETAARSSGDPEERLGAILDAFVDLALARPHLFSLMFTDKRPGARVLPAAAGDSPTLSVVLRVLEDGVRAGRFRDDDLAEVALGCAALTQGLCLARIGGRIDGSDEDFRALVARIAGRYVAGLRLGS